MLLDKIKSFALALALGLLATTFATFGGLKFVAARHHATVPDAWRFAFAQPVSLWPDDMQGMGLIALALGFGFIALLWWLLRDMRWSFGPSDLCSAYAAADLVAKSATQSPRIFAGNYNGHPFFASIEDRALVIGPPGTGKTAFLLNQLLRATKQGLSFVVVDFKPEIHAIIGNELAARGYRVLRINPTDVDADADHWNPLDEVDTESGIFEICAALLPIREAREAPFVEAQRDWFQAVVFHIKSQGGSLPDAYKLMTDESNPAKLLDILGRSASEPCARIARSIAAGLSGAKPDPLITQGLSGATRALKFLALPGVRDALGRSDFSMRDELGKGPVPTALFIQFLETESETFGQVLTLLATRVLTTLINTAGKRKPVAIFLDELGAIPPIPGLATKLNTIRSRHMPTWMYFQCVEHLERQYGKGATTLFFTAADVQMCFRLNDVETREMFSKLVGTTKRGKRSQSITAGVGGSTTTTTSKERENVIEPHELGQLKTGEVLCLYRGAATRGKGTPHYVTFPAFERKKS
ncbi:MAG TPA: type IV secretory system conjugative DNA transfer family protein [Sulfuricella sp.]|nr:type IV secretory system conjugative DNA transfer family protein [Sulfuricella sp.]